MSDLPADADRLAAAPASVQRREEYKMQNIAGETSQLQQRGDEANGTASSSISSTKSTARSSKRDALASGSMPDPVDEASDESFPASDAPASHRST